MTSGSEEEADTEADTEDEAVPAGTDPSLPKPSTLRGSFIHMQIIFNLKNLIQAKKEMTTY